MTPRLVRILVALSATALVSPLAIGGPPLGAQSPTATLRGHVRDNAHRPIAGAEVVIVGASLTSVADSSGQYTIDRVPPGAHNVRASFVGYRPRQADGVVFAPGDTVTKDFVLATTTPDSTSAGSAVLQGYVRDRNNVPIPHARIVIVGTVHTAVANLAGFYRVERVPAGKYQVRASFVGYRPVAAQDVALKPGEQTQQTFTLVPTAVEIQEITVVGGSNALVPRDQVTSRQLVDGGYTDRLPVEHLGNVFALQPGVPAGTGTVTMMSQGMRTDANTTDVDGVPIQPGVRSCVPPAADCRGNTEAYSRITDNPFRTPGIAPLSTFALDVDRASYSNVRRFITQGVRPPADAVRIEELINYFSYDYPAPAAGSEHPLTITTEVATAPWATAHRLVRIGLQSRPIATAQLPASNLVFLIDVSGSMRPANKLPLVKRAFALLVEQLRPADRVAIVVYAGSAGLVLESTSGAEQGEILAALERLDAGGSTAGGAGLRLAYQVAREQHITGGNNRVIIATDGDFNVGASSDAEMERLIEEERQHGTFLTVLGFGMGNYKDTKLELLADKGNGNYAYIDDLMEARKMLVQEMGGTLLTVAKDVKLQVEFNPSVVQAWRLIGYENRLLRDVDFNDDRKDGGELGAGHSVTALYEVVPVGAPLTVPIGGIDSLRYQAVPAQPSGRSGNELLFVKVRYKDPDATESRLLSHPVPNRVRRASADLTFAAAVAAFGMLLRNSEYRGDASVEQVLAGARSGLGDDRHGHRAAFVRMVEEFQHTTQVATLE